MVMDNLKRKQNSGVQEQVEGSSLTVQKSKANFILDALENGEKEKQVETSRKSIDS